VETPRPAAPGFSADGVDSIAGFTPRSIHEATASMQAALEFFHRTNDYRAVFLHMYYIITRNVQDEIESPSDPSNPIFLDPAWMSRLAGKFATLYYRSLRTFEKPASTERAWKLAHGLAIRKESTVLQDMILGITAHIKYDLAAAIAANLREHRDQEAPGALIARKRDHDNANTILRRSIREIKRTIPREYGGLRRQLHQSWFSLDELLAIAIVRYHREKVWWDALELIRCRDQQEVDRVMHRLDRESIRVAERLAGNRSVLVRTLRPFVADERRRDITVCTAMG
jgi:hypothetical protein